MPIARKEKIFPLRCLSLGKRVCISPSCTPFNIPHNWKLIYLHDMDWYVGQLGSVLQYVSLLHKYPGWGASISQYGAQRLLSNIYLSNICFYKLPVHKVVALNARERSSKVEVVSLNIQI